MESLAVRTQEMIQENNRQLAQLFGIQSQHRNSVAQPHPQQGFGAIHGVNGGATGEMGRCVLGGNNCTNGGADQGTNGGTNGQNFCEADHSFHEGSRKNQESKKDSFCWGGDNQEKIKNRAEGCDQKYQKENNKTDLLKQEETSGSQNTSCPLKEEVELQQQVKVIPNDFRNQGVEIIGNKTMAEILPYQLFVEMSQPGLVQGRIAKSMGMVNAIFFLGCGYGVFDPGGEQVLQERGRRLSRGMSSVRLLVGSQLDTCSPCMYATHARFSFCHNCVGGLVCMCSTAHNQENTFTYVAEDSTTSSTFGLVFGFEMQLCVHNLGFPCNKYLSHLPAPCGQGALKEGVL
jgi:hypothetical protein